MNKLIMTAIATGLVAAASAPAHATPSSVLYLNRCVGGCTVHSGADDAKSDTSSIPTSPGDSVLTEWAWGDAQWNAVVQCVKEVYSPYNIEVVTDRPSDNVVYNEQMVAGLGGQLGRSDAGGISPVEPCTVPATNVMTFTFANGWGPHGANPQQQQVWDICGVIGQESAHAFGLDHEWQYIDGKPSCSSPMTYRPTCGQQFFRNELAYCGEYAARACMCSDPQNSHLRLTAILGKGTPITAPPVVSVTAPANNATVGSGATVTAIASAQRGIQKVELAVNGYTWATVPGVAWGAASGQPQASYQLQIPAEVPDGVMDLVVTAKDDLDIATSAPAVRVTKGSPCTSEATCLAGQKCDAQGRCAWDPATGVLGDACTYPQFCESGLCNGPVGGQMTCTQECVVAASDSCPMGYECIQNNGGVGLCLPQQADNTGCCSTGSDAAAQSSLLGVALLVVVRRKRRR